MGYSTIQQTMIYFNIYQQRENCKSICHINMYDVYGNKKNILGLQVGIE